MLKIAIENPVVISTLCALPVLYGLWYMVGASRVGNRRSLLPIETDNDGQYVVRDTGLIEQWYTDQPCQRLYAITLSATWSAVGSRKLIDKTFISEVALALVKRHQSLACTIRRNADTNRAYVVVNSVNDMTALTQRLGPIPISWIHRKNAGTWRDAYQTLTHTEIAETSWLFRIAIVISDDEGEVGEGGQSAEVIIMTHHLICDGLSSTNLLNDFVYYLGTLQDDGLQQQTISLLPTLPVLAMDEVIDLRPPLSTVLQVIGEDALPTWLRSPPRFYQGPLPNCANPQYESHLATVTLSPTTTTRLITLAKQHHTSLNGLLSSILLMVQGKVARQFDSAVSSANATMATIPLKLQFPLGRASRQFGQIGSDQVGVYITAQELMVEIPTTPEGQCDDQILWSLAQRVTQAAKSDRLRKALDFLGLLNFLPRDSITPWFLKEGERVTMRRSGSVEFSNLGKFDGLEALLRDHKCVEQLFAPSNDNQPSAEKERRRGDCEVLLCQGRGYRGAVVGIGAVTCQDTLTLAITCQLGQCGCTGSLSGTTYEEAVSRREQSKQQQQQPASQVCGEVCCLCPEGNFLHQYATDVLQAIDMLVAQKQ